MSKIISGDALRERLLGRLASAPSPSPDSWVQAAATPGNRELLALIALRRPRSISELSELAGRAQPNVSRSLTALIHAGLVEVRSEGRVSVPILTDLARAKAQDIGIVDERSPAEAASLPLDLSDAGDLPFLSVAFAADSESDTDVIEGALIAAVIPRGDDEQTIARLPADLNRVVIGLLDHWWRMLYRRDAPYKLGEFAFSRAPQRRISLAVKSTGRRIERIVRSLDSGKFLIDGNTRYLPLEVFERELLDNVVRPVVSRMRGRLRYDRPIQSRLARLEDTFHYERERTFARTIGALGASPDDLTPEKADEVRRFIATMPDEDTRLEFASAVLTDEFAAAAAWTTSELSTQGERNTMPGLRELADDLRPNAPELGIRPWERGTTMARALRGRLNLAPDESIRGTTKVASLFGADKFRASPTAPPAALRGFQSELNGGPAIVVEEEGPQATPFTLARAIGDFLVFRSKASCVADLYTDRQAVGRAFAAEFMAPAEGVGRMIEDDDLPVVRVAKHFGVVPEVIVRQYENSYRRFPEA